MSSSQQQFENRFLNFSIAILALVSRLPKTRSGRHVADQLLRSGTSVGAQMREARSAESRADLIHKMQIGLKEARESHYWLEITQGAKLLNDETGLVSLVREAYELTAILAKSVITAKKNSGRGYGLVKADR